MSESSRATKKETKATLAFSKTGLVLSHIKLAISKAKTIRTKLYGVPTEDKEEGKKETINPDSFFDRIFYDLNEMISLGKELHVVLNEIEKNL